MMAELTSSLRQPKRTIFQPGLYYIRGGGFKLKNVDGGGGATDFNAMCTTCAANADTGMGMVVYDSPAAGSTSTGGFDINTNVSITLKGSTKTTTNSKNETVPAAPYYNILFWEDRTADAHTGSNPFQRRRPQPRPGQRLLFADRQHLRDEYAGDDVGGMPITTRKWTITATSSGTVQQGYIIVSSLQIVGATTIRMNLVPYGFLNIRQIALVR
jgi:hypothetical protein